MGHYQGVERVRDITRKCGELGVKYLTLYTFSTENWQRPEEEVREIMSLLTKVIRREEKELMENNVKLKVIGRIKDLPKEPRRALRELIRKTSNNTGLVLTLALSYGGRQEIIDAVKKIRGKRVSIKNFKNYLYDPDLPDPDLLIRTGGEMRISNFLLWQIAYSELYFTKTLWPDFSKEELLKAIKDYSSRERRFGRVRA